MQVLIADTRNALDFVAKELTPVIKKMQMFIEGDLFKTLVAKRKLLAKAFDSIELDTHEQMLKTHFLKQQIESELRVFKTMGMLCVSAYMVCERIAAAREKYPQVWSCATPCADTMLVGLARLKENAKLDMPAEVPAAATSNNQQSRRSRPSHESAPKHSGGGGGLPQQRRRVNDGDGDNDHESEADSVHSESTAAEEESGSDADDDDPNL